MFKQNSSQGNYAVQSSSKTMISLHFPQQNSHVRELLDSIFHQSASHGDCLLKIGRDLREFRCHRSILTFASDFLAKLLLPLSKDPVIVIPDIDSDVFSAVLSYIYAGELNISPANINGFIEACTLLEIKGIVDQQYKLLDLIETSTNATEERKDDEYTIIDATNTEEVDFEDPVERMSDEETSIMEEEYVLEEESTEPIIISSSLEVPETTNPTPPKKIHIPTIQKSIEKIPHGFREIESSIGNWKSARLLTDGTTNINWANAKYFKERLDICTAKIYENVEIPEDPSAEKFRARMYFCPAPASLKALVECLICHKAIQVSYKQKNGKFKQWINSNVLRHVETLHKNNIRHKV